jgi:hypothetical protein
MEATDPRSGAYLMAQTDQALNALSPEAWDEIAAHIGLGGLRTLFKSKPISGDVMLWGRLWFDAIPKATAPSIRDVLSALRPAEIALMPQSFVHRFATWTHYNWTEWLQQLWGEKGLEWNRNPQATEGPPPVCQAEAEGRVWTPEKAGLQAATTSS